MRVVSASIKTYYLPETKFLINILAITYKLHNINNQKEQKEKWQIIVLRIA